jgi:hypothetical protein
MDTLPEGDGAFQYPPELAVAELAFLWRAVSGKTVQVNSAACQRYL